MGMRYWNYVMGEGGEVLLRKGRYDRDGEKGYVWERREGGEWVRGRGGYRTEDLIYGWDGGEFCFWWDGVMGVG